MWDGRWIWGAGEERVAKQADVGREGPGGVGEVARTRESVRVGERAGERGGEEELGA